ncbi:TadE family protein [Solirhodobacter olei]|uniref:TadE family protein n=1 Tax=Solirhodobacter olei TaxID=2493082 RepID=UPI0013E30BEE|nr:TadE/TadG family type IV pilus assembly protein [Solirhodobacter olei]
MTSPFAAKTDGAVTAEFVIILPVFIMLFVMMVAISVILATASEVQQVSFDLTRGSLRYYEPGIDPATLCSDVKTRLAPSVMQSGIFLEESQFTNLRCAMDPSADKVTVSVTYKMPDNPAMWLAGMVGIDVSSLTRSSTMWM